MGRDGAGKRWPFSTLTRRPVSPVLTPSRLQPLPGEERLFWLTEGKSEASFLSPSGRRNVILLELGLDVGVVVAAAIVSTKIRVIGDVVVIGSRVGVGVWVRIRVGGLIGVTLIHLATVFVPLVVIVIDDFRVLCGCGSAK